MVSAQIRQSSANLLIRSAWQSGDWLSMISYLELGAFRLTGQETLIHQEEQLSQHILIDSSGTIQTL